MATRSGMVALALAVGVSLAGCAGSVKGEVDGKKPAVVKSGFWYTAYDGEDGVIVYAVLASVNDYCTVSTKVLEDQTGVITDFVEGRIDEDEANAEIAAISEEHLPSEFWETYAGFLAEGMDDLEGDGYDMGGEAPDSVLEIYFHDGYIDWLGLFLAGDGQGTETKYYGSESGSAEVSAFDEDGTFKGKGEAEMVDSDGGSAGDVTFSFSVQRCEAYEDALQDLYTIIQGS